MNTAQATPRPLPAIALWTPPHRRWLDALAPWIERAHDALERVARRRARRRAEREQLAALAALDAHMLRDIGAADWVVSAREVQGTMIRRELEPRGL